jgi:NNP family nitrate/nitrite transporter-like MFS transporter
LILFALLAKDSPRRSAPAKWAEYAAALREPDAAWFSFFYSFTFGGFVGLASFLTTFFHDQYALSKVQAGDFTTIVVLAGSFLRPVGGWLSDRIGGYRLLLLLLVGVSGCLMGVGKMPVLPLEVVLLFLTMGMLGMGNGAVFQLVPQRFPERVGLLTGLVGAAGGLGGFFLPFLLGAFKQRTGQYSGGLFLFGAGFLLAAVILLQLGTRWRANWQEEAIERSGIFSYRNFSGSTADQPAE